MKIIVPIKQILDPGGLTFRRDKERMFINVEEYVIDPASKAAIEAALRLKGAADQVVAITLDQPRADDALREALAMGCDEGYLLSDTAFQEADISVTVRVLGAAIEKLGGADLVITGRESGDSGAGQVGPRLAEALGYALITDTHALEAANGELQATRRWDDGFATVRALLPAIVAVAPEGFQPRYAPGARIMNAYREWEVTVWDAADLGLEKAALTPLLTLRSESFPPPLEVGEEFRGDPETVAQEVVTALRLQKLIS